MDFYFGEHLRLDWGFENPNKTAALIAGLLVLVHALRYLIKWKRIGFWIFIAAFLSLGVCLIHTYSRGGILAAVAGQLAFYVTRHLKFRVPSRTALFTAFALGILLTLYSALPQVEAIKRYSQGMGEEEVDRSVTNRLRIWKDVPQMILDAPNGWGHDKVGEAWMLWYQPLDTRYRYRTLVNSHLTWLAGFGWAGRFLYLGGWCLILLTCFAPRIESNLERQSASIAVGVWTTLAVSAFFSSVGESALLWLLPLVSLAWMILGSSKLREAIKDRARLLKHLGISACFAVLCIAALYLAGFATNNDREPIHRSKQFLRYGEGEAKTLIVQPDFRVMGRHFSYEIRKNPRDGWLVSDEVPNEIPGSIDQIILSGMIPDLRGRLADFRGQIVYLNPLNSFEIQSRQEGKTKIILGNLRRDPTSLVLRQSVADVDEWNLIEKPGKQVYLGNWVEFVSKESHP